MCALSIKVPTRKKSGNLFYDPRTCFVVVQYYRFVCFFFLMVYQPSWFI